MYLHQTPMFHAASMGGILGIPATGGVSTFVPMFEPGAVLDAIESHGVTFTVMVPTMIGMLLDHPEFAPDRMASLELLTYGASPMPGALLERLLNLFPDLDIHQGYGMTECSAVLTSLGPDEHRLGGELLGSAGRPVPGVMLSIQDPEGRSLPRRETGEVCARAGNFMREYWKRPEETAEAFRGGWYHTGDAGYLDENGYLHLVDRVKDMVVTGGENVYSVEVENALATHPAVAQVAVIGIPDDRWGEAVHAVVVLKPNVAATGTTSRPTPASGSRATSCRGRSSSATSRCRSRGRSRYSNASCGHRTGKAGSGPSTDGGAWNAHLDSSAGLRETRKTCRRRTSRSSGLSTRRPIAATGTRCFATSIPTLSRSFLRLLASTGGARKFRATGKTF